MQRVNTTIFNHACMSWCVPHFLLFLLFSVAPSSTSFSLSPMSRAATQRFPASIHALYVSVAASFFHMPHLWNA